MNVLRDLHIDPVKLKILNKTDVSHHLYISPKIFLIKFYYEHAYFSFAYLTIVTIYKNIYIYGENLLDKIYIIY